jgi:gluconolactonase
MSHGDYSLSREHCEFREGLLEKGVRRCVAWVVAEGLPARCFLRLQRERPMSRFGPVMHRLAGIAAMACLPVLAAAQDSIAGLCGACQPSKFATCGGFLEGPSIDSAGGLWVVDVTGGRILKISGNGDCVSQGKTGGMPNGSKFTKDGRLFVTDSRLGLITFDPVKQTAAVVAGKYNGIPLMSANDLAIDRFGGVYFTVPAGSALMNPIGKVLYLAPDGKDLRMVIDKIAYPNGIAISPDGETVLIAEFAAQRIISVPSLTAKGGFPLTYVYATTRGGIGPDGIAMDHAGRLYVANFGSGEVLVFSPQGVPLGAIELPASAGKMVSNLVIHGQELYVTEGSKGEIWRVHLKTAATN